MAFIAPRGIHLRSEQPAPAISQPFRMTKMTRLASTGVRKLHIETPLIVSSTLSNAFGSEVLLKLDNLQPGGSFKIRGHGHLVSVHTKNGKKRFISSSGGNAGMAVALACEQLGVRATIVLPQSTPDFMKSRLKGTGADVIVQGAVWNEADEYARRLQREDPSAVYVSPFDDTLLWEGHASLVHELPEKPRRIIVSVGGGGLLLGVIHGLRARGWRDVEVIAAETEGADSFAQMLKAEKIVQLKGIFSIAKSLGALAVSERCLDVVKEGWNIRSVVVSDKEAVEACSGLAVNHRILVEPACGVAVAALKQLNSTEKDRVGDQGSGATVVVVCGGSMTSPALLAHWISSTGAEEVAL